MLVLLREMGLGAASKWFPYIKMLPDRYTTAHWLGKEGTELLEGTYALQVAKGELEYTQELVQMVKQQRGEGAHTVNEIVRALSAVRSHAMIHLKNNMANIIPR